MQVGAVALAVASWAGLAWVAMGGRDGLGALAAEEGAEHLFELSAANVDLSFGATRASALSFSDAAAGQRPMIRPTFDASEAGLGLATVQVVVAANDTLERIFRRMELSLQDLAAIRALPAVRKQLDRLRPGESLTIASRHGEVVSLERQLSLSETLQVRRRENGHEAGAMGFGGAGAAFESKIVTNPLEVAVRTASGVVSSSLFRAAEQAGISDATALAIAKIFEYDIDFVLDIQPEDRFTIVYERISRDGETLKDGEILAAEFVNQGRVYRAVRYVTPDGAAGYYTPEGLSLRKAFIRAPLEFTRISSRFNPRRRHPVLNTIRAHKGVDYAAPTGTPVRAAGDGRVRFVGRKGGYGNVIELEHTNRVTTLYGHLSRFAKGVRRGDRVRQGQLIGYVGRTGLASGPHLHYEYRLNGLHQDPQRVKLPTADPVPRALLAAFREETANPLAQLQRAAQAAAPLGPAAPATPASPVGGRTVAAR